MRSCFPSTALRRQKQPGFTLIEAMAAITVTAMAASVLLLAVETTVQSTADSEEGTIAAGIARQIVNEVVACRYQAPGTTPYQYPLGPNATEAAGNGRELFDDSDDFHQFTAQPAEDRYGNLLGQGSDQIGLRHANFCVRSSYFTNWRQQITLTYVSESDPTIDLSGSSTSNLRAVTVVITKHEPDGGVRELARIRRVFAYVAPPA